MEGAARRERERQRRLVRIGDHDIDVGAGDMAALIDALQVNLDANPAVIAAPNRISDLQPIPATRPRGGGGGGGGGSRDPMAGLSDEQRQALGFAGEWLADQWLTRLYPEANESSWVSTNRRRVFAGGPGDDSLGFDFRVERAHGPIMFEVKASRDDPGMFTLTDSEIREARRHARDGRWRLLIVPFVSDPARCRVLRLPNPFEARTDGLFRADGEGIRYRYHLPH
jgi:Protein NO VEIN, C-terminal